MGEEPAKAAERVVSDRLACAMQHAFGMNRQATGDEGREDRHQPRVAPLQLLRAEQGDVEAAEAWSVAEAATTATIGRTRRKLSDLIVVGQLGEPKRRSRSG
jgi:hypothetical protein